MKRQPYVVDELTGRSRTRDFVVAFLEAYTSPSGETRSVYDTLFSTVPVPQEPLYQNKPANNLKRYFGRAATVHDNGNSNEYLWCLVADISLACRTLDADQKQAIDLKYVRDMGEHEIASKLGVPVRTVFDRIESSIDVITATLDGNA